MRSCRLQGTSLVIRRRNIRLFTIVRIIKMQVL